MKHTISLQNNRKATIEIPYSKLTAQSTQYKQNYQTQDCCDSKIVVLGCRADCGKSRSSIHMAAIVELEQAYDRDVDELNHKIKQLQREKQLTIAKYTSSNDQLRKEFDFKLEQSKETIDFLQTQCKKKDKQIADLLNEKEIIVRNKISEFRQNQYIQKIRQLQHIIKLKESQIQNGISKSELLHLQNIQSEELRRSEQLKWERQVSNLKTQFSTIQNQYSRSRLTESYSSKTREEDNNRIINQLKSGCEALREQNRQLTINLQNLKTQNMRVLGQKERLQADIPKYQQQITQLSQHNHKIRLQSDINFSKLSQLDDAILMLDRQKGDLLLEIQKSYIQIQKLKFQLNNKQKVYEVKIERVVDGQAEIQQMQTVIYELELQLKQLSSHKDILTQQVKKREIFIQELQTTITKYSAEISQLKAYIQRREGSFKWVVERQIQKDMQVAQKKPQIYKVSQVHEFSREVKLDQKSPIQKITAALHSNLKGNFVERIILTGSNPNQ